MATINFGTSDYITLGIEPYECEELNSIYGDSPDSYDLYELYCDDEENAKTILDGYDFKFFNVSIKYGYYESLYIDIKAVYSMYGTFYESYTEKMDALKEVSSLKKCLIDLADVGFTACYPGWCTSFESHEGTLKAINEAVKEIRQEIKEVPTYRQFIKTNSI